MEIKRRNFIKTLSFASGGLLMLPACARLEHPWRFFTQEEAETVIAIAEQIIPSDTDAGATEAGVINFIDLQLTGFYSNYQESYRNGINALQQFCVEKHKNIFEKLEWEIQTDVLNLMEKNSIEGDYWKKNPSSRFFRLLRDHTMQGFYGSPRHGGNKYYASYKMIGIEYPHIIGQNRYSPLSKTLNINKK
jgi:gluconate 2-dehydrogenase gamma chain